MISRTLVFAFCVAIAPGCDALRGKATEDAGPAPVAPKEMAAAKTPPKPKAPPPVPPLPDLPLLDEQEKAPPKPANARTAFVGSPGTELEFAL